MVSRRKFLRIAGLGIGGVVLSTKLSGCSVTEEKTVKLPNGYEAAGHTYKSPRNKFHYNLKSKEEGLIEKSYLDGAVTNVGTTTVGDYPDRFVHAIEVRMQPHDKSLGEYFLQIWRGRISPDEVKKDLEIGANLSIPTLRKYDSPDNLYKILNSSDEVRTHEIEFIT